MKHINKLLLLAASSITFASAQQQDLNDLDNPNPNRPDFNLKGDLLVAQFDANQDSDDIHTQASLGCILASSKFQDVKAYGVMGAYGYTIKKREKFIPSDSLMNLIFGKENRGWTDAHNDLSASVTRIHNVVKPVLERGDKVWIQEAGNSDITQLWVQALLDSGVSAETVKNNVILVQHALGNETKSTDGAINFLKSQTNYWQIDSGNTRLDGNRGPQTPDFQSKITDTQYLEQAFLSPNPTARLLWTEAENILVSTGTKVGRNHTVAVGGVDFSDGVENIWIFDINDAGSINAFWRNYVTNDVSTPEPQLVIGSKVTLQGQNNKYVLCKSNGALKCNTGSRKSATRFTVVDAGSGKIAFTTNEGKFIKASSTGKLTCRSTSMGNAGKFTVEYLNDKKLSLICRSGDYVSSENGERRMRCNREAATSSEVFTWR